MMSLAQIGYRVNDWYNGFGTQGLNGVEMYFDNDQNEGGDGENESEDEEMQPADGESHIHLRYVYLLLLRLAQDLSLLKAPCPLLSTTASMPVLAPPCASLTSALPKESPSLSSGR